MITRADIAGALKLVHANSLKNRRGHIEKMVATEHPPAHVSKIMSDLHTYPGWEENKHLDEPAPSASAVPKKKK